MPLIQDPNLLMGIESLDDAGVYKLNDDLAIIQTIDFFTPIVDDPYDFGQITAANALSDIYAMGGKPLTAMNVVCFPINKLDITILKDILRGGLDKLREAEVTLVGGHSIDDAELKYGLSVTGTVHPERVVTTYGARAGDRIILTKPLGTGIISTALKAGEASKETAAMITKSMASLNKTASELMQQTGPHACTDVTGFGLIGHAINIARESNAGIKIYSHKLPIFPEIQEFTNIGLIPGGLHRNAEFYSKSVHFSETIPQYMKDVLFDPQTSGGLLISVSAESAAGLLDRLHEAGVKDAVIVGEVIDYPAGEILVEP